MKKLSIVRKNNQPHWVGDGFPVRTMFTYNDFNQQSSPFLLLDYAEPYKFAPTTERKGVGEHPHRGFETVTIVFDGEVEHRDSAGGGGVIGRGDVQWMTAGSGLVHEEKHGKNFAKNGGPFEMVQLWVNLPKKDKMTAPRYQGLKESQIPRVVLQDGESSLRVIAGNYHGAKGPARTFSPTQLWDLRLRNGFQTELPVPQGHNALVLILDGVVEIDGKTLDKATLGVFESDGAGILIKASADAKILLMAGEPLNESVVGYGPFVMSSEAEIRQSFLDYEAGKFGTFENIPGSENSN